MPQHVKPYKEIISYGTFPTYRMEPLYFQEIANMSREMCARLVFFLTNGEADPDVLNTLSDQVLLSQALDLMEHLRLEAIPPDFLAEPQRKRQRTDDITMDIPDAFIAQASYTFDNYPAMMTPTQVPPVEQAPPTEPSPTVMPTAAIATAPDTTRLEETPAWPVVPAATPKTSTLMAVESDSGAQERAPPRGAITLKHKARSWALPEHKRLSLLAASTSNPQKALEVTDKIIAAKTDRQFQEEVNNFRSSQADNKFAAFEAIVAPREVTYYLVRADLKKTPDLDFEETIGSLAEAIPDKARDSIATSMNRSRPREREFIYAFTNQANAEETLRAWRENLNSQADDAFECIAKTQYPIVGGTQKVVIKGVGLPQGLPTAEIEELIKASYGVRYNTTKAHGPRYAKPPSGSQNTDPWPCTTSIWTQTKTLRRYAKEAPSHSGPTTWPSKIDLTTPSRQLSMNGQEEWNQPTKTQMHSSQQVTNHSRYQLSSSSKISRRRMALHTKGRGILRHRILQTVRDYFFQDQGSTSLCRSYLSPHLPEGEKFPRVANRAGETQGGSQQEKSRRKKKTKVLRKRVLIVRTRNKYRFPALPFLLRTMLLTAKVMQAYANEVKLALALWSISSLVQQAEGVEIELFSINLGDRSKLVNTVTCIAALSAVVILTQEDHLSRKEFELKTRDLPNYTAIGTHRTRSQTLEKKAKNRAKNWKAKALTEIDLDLLAKTRHSPNRRGSAIWIRNDWANKITSSWTDRKFRTIWVALEVSKSKALIICNVYGPNEKGTKRDSYWKNVERKTKRIKTHLETKYTKVEIIIGGDFNARLDPTLDKKINKGTEAPDLSVSSMIENLNLFDAFRTLHEDTREYTWLASPAGNSPDKQETRIDLWLTSEIENTLECRILPFNAIWSSDHKPVKLKYDLQEAVIPTPLKHIEELRKESFRPRFILNDIEGPELGKKLSNITLPSIQQLKDLLAIPEPTLEHINEAYNLFISELVDALKVALPQTKFREKGPSSSPKQDKKFKELLNIRSKLKQILYLTNKKLTPETQEKITNLLVEVNPSTHTCWEAPSNNHEKEELTFRVKEKLSTIEGRASKRLKKVARTQTDNIVKSCIERRKKPKVLFKVLKDKRDSTELCKATQYGINPNAEAFIPHSPEEAIEINSTPPPNSARIPRTLYEPPEIIEAHHAMWQAIFTERLQDPGPTNRPLPFTKTKYRRTRHSPKPTISRENILKDIRNSKNSSPGPDGIPNAIWKALPKGITETLIDLIVKIWETEHIPDQWKTSDIILLHKGGDKALLVNYRPIALCQCTYKFFTKQVLANLLEHEKSNGFIDELQFGGRPGSSTTQALLTYMAVLEDARIHKKKLYVLMLDLAKAYDSVTFFLLERTLKYYKFPPKLISLVRKLYEDNVGNLHTPLGKAKKKIEFKSGVKQGCGLSPLLWVIFINPILEQIRETNLGYKFNNNPKIKVPHVTYMDDMNIITDSLEEMQAIADIITDLLRQMGLKLNPKKCLLLVKDPLPEDTITLDNIVIKPIDGGIATKYLGVMVNFNLSWEELTKTLVTATSANLSKLNATCLSAKQKIEVFNKVICPAIAYPLNVAVLDQDAEKKLDTIITQTIKKACKLRTNFANCRLWMEKSKGGAGLISVSHLNRTTFLPTLIKQALNSNRSFPKLAIQQNLDDKNIKLGEEYAYLPRGEGLTGQVVDSAIRFPLEIRAKKSLKVVPGPGITYVNPKPADFITEIATEEKILPVWTDGSWHKSRKATCSTVIGNTTTERKRWNATIPDSSTSAELEAIAEAATITARNARTVIFTDSEASKEIFNQIAKDEVPEGALPKRIANTLDQLKRKNKPPPKVYWVPSHMDKPEKKSKAKLDKANATLTHLSNTFSITKEAIIEGNVAADSTAGEAVDSHNQEPSVFAESPYLSALINGKPTEKNIRREARKLLKDIEYKNRLSLTKKDLDNWKDIDTKLSNAHLQKPEYDNIFEWTLRLRALNIYTSDKAFEITLKEDNKPQSIFLETVFPTPECPTCHVVADIWHLWECPDFQEIKQAVEGKVNNLLRPLDPYFEPYWWTPEAPQANTQPPANPRRSCLCHLPDHGTYLYCVGCKKQFHPWCLGVNKDIKDMGVRERMNFKCRTCHPTSPLYWQKGSNQQQKVSRETLLTEIVEVTSKQNISVRKWNLEKWTKSKLEEAKDRRRNTTPSNRLKQRAILGHLPKGTVNHFRDLAEARGVSRKDIDQTLIKVNTTIIEGSRDLYREAIKRNWKEREREGVPIKYLKRSWGKIERNFWPTTKDRGNR
jgi:exonuclease III